MSDTTTLTLCAVHNSGFNWSNGPLRCDAYRLMAVPGRHHGIEDCRERTFRQSACDSCCPQNPYVVWVEVTDPPSP